MKTDLQKYREPEQLVLEFFILEEEDQQKYSQSIELYDAIPKYIWSRVKRDENGFLPTLKRKFKHKNHEYEVQIRPARLFNKEGEEKHYYPGIREEIVEDALRKIATEGRIERVDGEPKKNLGIVFTLYELKKELERTGHSYNNTQIKEALRICSRTGLTVICHSKGGSIEVDENMFPRLALATRSEWDKDKQRAHVEFNSLVTKSIEKRTYRQINYERSMKLSSSLARWLHKRMSHNYKQAQSFQNVYTISLITIIRDSGMTAYKRLSDSKKYVMKSIDELMKLDVIYKCDEEVTKDGKKLADVKFSLYPSLTFSSEMKRANAKMKSIR
jgi:hypothetical protein